MSRVLRTITIIGAMVLAVLGRQPASAVLIAFEGFEDYAADVPLGGLNGGSGWTAAWGSGVRSPDELKTIAGGLSYITGEVSNPGGNRALQFVYDVGGNAIFLNRPFASQTGTVYMSLLWQTTTAYGDGDDDFIQYGLNSAACNPRTSVVRWYGNDGYDFQVRSGTGQGRSASVATNPGQTYFLVLRASDTGTDGIYDRVELWVNPVSQDPGTTSIVHNANSGISSLQYFVGRHARLNRGDTYRIDNIRIGTSFLDVIPFIPIPEPASGLLALLGVLGLCAARRRRRPNA